jgi:hypothetical protein
MARAENHEDEVTTEEEGFSAKHGHGNALIATDEYIESSLEPHLISLLYTHA